VNQDLQNWKCFIPLLAASQAPRSRPVTNHEAPLLFSALTCLSFPTYTAHRAPTAKALNTTCIGSHNSHYKVDTFHGIAYALSRATHWPRIGLYIAISPPLGHHHSLLLYQYTPHIIPTAHSGLDMLNHLSNTGDISSHRPRAGLENAMRIPLESRVWAMSSIF
jgi:hypothetical protein